MFLRIFTHDAVLQEEITRSYICISPILNELHWLPVEKRITFKLLILAYKCNQGVAPQYLLDIVKSYQPARNLRSSSINLLTPDSAITKDMGKELFSMQFLSYGTHYQIT